MISFSSPHRNIPEGRSYYEPFPERKNKMTQKGGMSCLRCQCWASASRSICVLGSSQLALAGGPCTCHLPPWASMSHLESGANSIIHLPALQGEPILRAKSQAQHIGAVTVILRILSCSLHPPGGLGLSRGRARSWGRRTRNWHKCPQDKGRKGTGA